MRKLNIMVVEDERIVARDVQKILEAMGHTVLASVSSAEEAIQKIVRAQPDLVLMDIRLQGEMDGVEAAGRIRRQFGVPVIYLTAYADEETVRRAQPTEPFGFIVKPFEAVELRTVITMAMQRLKLERQLEQQGAIQAELQHYRQLHHQRIGDLTTLDGPEEGTQSPAERRPRQTFERSKEIPLEARAVWQVHSGLVKLSKLHPSGEEVLIGLAGPDRLFGPTLTSLEACRATALSRVELVRHGVQEISPATATGRLLQTQIERGIHQTEALLAIYGQRYAGDRLRGVLLLLAVEIGCPVAGGVRLEVRLTHEELATVLGVERATVTVLLGRLEKQGWLTHDSRHHLILKDRLLKTASEEGYRLPAVKDG
ncbi:response regulator [Gloeobacter violaceus]|uniref:Two-component response regulator n=1 Tax=Gloeobacter violaceus (strain ATCC 29082 / PCC 7421) TaxID=251221 RepID=Q7NJR4_GLOVI|nr:response regulator [Gloeobacter violaceus]BAC89709.1 two-component response regulator [Gloeobacter violaceus PCC 7421]